ncbi:hypothetical protein HDF16_006260 [Granulicella aggregans]|uniref:Uncharacterized protein n=1 Tax=Granulicella aggregans TaxID=474949 RepID=A0A7W7ZKC0_9BACT|nr:hypothetical protein [Granulicella aggregans]
MTLKMTIPVHSYLFVLSTFTIAAVNRPFLLGQVLQIGHSDFNLCKKVEHTNRIARVAVAPQARTGEM